MDRNVHGGALTALLMFASLTGETSVAAEAADANDSGFYLTAAVSRVQHDAPASPLLNTTPQNPVVSRRASDVDTGYSVGAGYRLNRYLAAEATYVDLGEVSVHEEYRCTCTEDYSIRVRGPAVSVLGSLPIGEQWLVFLRGGRLFGKQTESHFLKMSGMSAPWPDKKYDADVNFFGAGAQWSFAPQMAARLEYQSFDEMKYGTGSTTPAYLRSEHQNKIDQLSLSIVFRL